MEYTLEDDMKSYNLRIQVQGLTYLEHFANPTRRVEKYFMVWNESDNLIYNLSREKIVYFSMPPWPS